MVLLMLHTADTLLLYLFCMCFMFVKCMLSNGFLCFLFNYLSVIKYYLSLIKYYLSVIINYLSVIIENSTGKTKTNPIGNGSESYRK